MFYSCSTANANYIKNCDDEESSILNITACNQLFRTIKKKLRAIKINANSVICQHIVIKNMGLIASVTSLHIH